MRNAEIRVSGQANDRHPKGSALVYYLAPYLPHMPRTTISAAAPLIRWSFSTAR